MLCDVCRVGDQHDERAASDHGCTAASMGHDPPAQRGVTVPRRSAIQHDLTIVGGF